MNDLLSPRSSDQEAEKPGAADPQHALHLGLWPLGLWLQELAYLAVLALTIFGVAYTSYSKQPIAGYWEFLAPVIGLLCVITGWRHAHTGDMRLRLIWTQALHWLAFTVAMSLVFLPGVRGVVNANATGLTILTLLALGTFTAGVHILSWQVCALGVVMALGVPAIAWIEGSALFLSLVAVVAIGIGLALWWFRGAKSTARAVP
jgi:hypothetical protein